MLRKYSGALALIIITSLVSASVTNDAVAQSADWLSYTDSVRQAWESPDSKLLPRSERAGFQGIHYLPYDSAYRLTVQYTPLAEADTLVVGTTRNTVSRYLPIAQIEFSMADTTHRLTVYRGLDPWSEMDRHFVMFNDLTNGETTYGGGRYLELQAVDEAAEVAVLDFNFSYNPYCAYAARYSCPIPPAGNQLSTHIRAGIAYP